ncbi:MAG TPA: magnesium-translocating P-type ATPase [Burkholderiales bacterium]|nr:magnesium-translocating P-type ATPase [Burkholderiales bacterium]
MNLAVLKDFFTSFVRAHGMARHFRRTGIFDLLKGIDAKKELPLTPSIVLMSAAQADITALLAELGTHVDGLTEAQSGAVLERLGPNEIQQEKPQPWWLHLWYCYRNPFNLLLTLLAVISYYTEDITATLVIGSMVALATLIRFFEESRSNKAVDQLKEMVSNTATVVRRDPAAVLLEQAGAYFEVQSHPRPPHKVETPIKYLVPGDVVTLSAGDMVPADVRLMVAKDLFANQAAMTGESLPVEKFALVRDSTRDVNPIELDNICFMGTNIVSGSAKAVVITTGNRTFLGTLAQRASAVERTPTSFQQGVNKVSWLLVRFMLVMTPIVFFMNGFTKGNWLDAALFSISIAIGLTPEMLPMIVTATLAKGAVYLSRKKVIVKRLDAIQNFGAMNVLCTDKTGTLTEDRIVLERHTDLQGTPSDDVLEYAYLNSYYQTGLKSLLDVTVLRHADLQRELNLATRFRKVDEIPFDFMRRRMSVVVAECEDTHILISKGAIEEIVAACTRVRLDGGDKPFSAEQLAQVQATSTALREQGLRVVAVAAKELRPIKETYGVADECDLTLIGYIAFLDPPKESAAPALTALRAHGVTVKVLTGDNEIVTAKICREVELPMDGVLLGSDVETMDDAELARAAESYNVFARLTPMHKERIVRMLRNNGHVVGFLGDGINDAPALRTADIGISVDSAVDIARESADLILLEKSLMVLEAGVLEGRRTSGNMLKYIKMNASSNFGNVFSVLVASAFLPFLPMLPLQLLMQNLLYDFSQVAIPFDHVDADALVKPMRWNSNDIGRFMVFFGPISSIFDIATFALMWFVFRANSPETQTLFQSGWFVEGLLSQTLIVHMIRTRKIPFLQSSAAPPLLVATACIVAIGIFLPLGPIASYFKLQPLPWLYFPWLVIVLAAYIVLTQGMKNFYARRFGWQ